MSKSDIAVSVRGISKSYTIAHDEEKHNTLAVTMLSRLKNPLRRPKTDTFWALKDVSFDIKKGDVVGIIGRNGAGKSTLLKILSRITEPTTGVIDLYGRVGSLLEVGTGFHPELTGRENIFLNGAILGMTKGEIARQFDAIVDFAEIGKFLDTPVKRYSSGMYVRLAFAVAAHLDSEILILDEVLAVGDATFQKKCFGKMSEVASAGRTVLFVSHDLTSILKLTNTALLLERGEVRQFGPTKAVATTYLSHVTDQPERIDLSTAVRPCNLRGSAQLRFVKLIASNTLSPWKLPFGSRVSLEVGFHLAAAGHDIDLGMGLFTQSGFEVASTLSSHIIGVQDLEAGDVAMKVQYTDLVLAPGVYRFGIGLRSHRGMEDYIAEAVLLEIVTSKEAAAANTETMRGTIVPKVSCELSVFN